MGRLLTAAIVTVICTTGLAAQSTQSAQTKDEAQNVPVLTVSGCLRNGDEPGTFVLSAVKWLDKTSAEKSAVGTSGSDADNSGATLRLVGTPSGVRLSEHVGHTVEITGTLIDEVAPKPMATAGEVAPKPTATADEVAQPPSPQPAQPPSHQPPPKSGHTLNVRTIKMIGENCTAR
jgi:hypothetical protein